MIGWLLVAPPVVELLDRDRPVPYAGGHVRPSLYGLSRGGCGCWAGVEQASASRIAQVANSLMSVIIKESRGSENPIPPDVWRHFDQLLGLRPRGLQMWRLGMPIERSFVTPPLNEAEIAGIGRISSRSYW